MFFGSCTVGDQQTDVKQKNCSYDCKRLTYKSVAKRKRFWIFKKVRKKLLNTNANGFTRRVRKQVVLCAKFIAFLKCEKPRCYRVFVSFINNISYILFFVSFLLQRKTLKLLWAVGCAKFFCFFLVALTSIIYAFHNQSLLFVQLDTLWKSDEAEENFSVFDCPNTGGTVLK